MPENTVSIATSIVADRRSVNLAAGRETRTLGPLRVRRLNGGALPAVPPARGECDETPASDRWAFAGWLLRGRAAAAVRGAAAASAAAAVGGGRVPATAAAAADVRAAAGADVPAAAAAGHDVPAAARAAGVRRPVGDRD